MRNRMVTGALCATVLIGVAPIAAANAATGPMGFDPIAGSAYDEASTTWSEPFVVPDGFTQTLVADETDLDIYAGEDDLTDMNTSTRPARRPGGTCTARTRWAPTAPSPSSTSRPARPKVLEQQDALDIPAWTASAGRRGAPSSSPRRPPAGTCTRSSSTRRTRRTALTSRTRTQLGILRHEGIGRGADGSVYVIDELNGGSIYKFVPTVRGDLSDGQLYALKLTGLTDAEQLWNQATFVAEGRRVRVGRPRQGAGRRSTRMSRRTPCTRPSSAVPRMWSSSGSGSTWRTRPRTA